MNEIAKYLVPHLAEEAEETLGLKIADTENEGRGLVYFSPMTGSFIDDLGHVKTKQCIRETMEDLFGRRKEQAPDLLRKKYQEEGEVFVSQVVDETLEYILSHVLEIDVNDINYVAERLDDIMARYFEEVLQVGSQQNRGQG